MAILQCELSKVASVDWMKGMETLRDRDIYSLQQDEAVHELQIHGLAAEDAGDYLYVMCVRKRGPRPC